MMPVPRHTSAKNANTLASIVNWIQYGRPTSCVARSNQRIPIAAMPSPARPLTTASSTLSSSSWRITRQRDAPSDTRTEISRARLVARDSSRLATFAQAISSTNATAPISDRNTVRIGPPFCCSLNVCTRAWMSLLVSGFSASIRFEMLTSSLCAWARVTPGAKWPNACSERVLRFCSSSPVICASGIQRSVLKGKRKPSGMTPMIVAGTSLMRTWRPMTDGLEP